MLLLFGFGFSSFVIAHSVLVVKVNEDIDNSHQYQKSLKEGISNIRLMVFLVTMGFLTAFTLEFNLKASI